MHPHSPPEVKVSLHKSPAGHSVLPLCCYQRHICYWLCISPVHEHRVQRSVWACDPPFKALEVCNNKALALTCFIRFPSLWHREGGGPHLSCIPSPTAWDVSKDTLASLCSTAVYITTPPEVLLHRAREQERRKQSGGWGGCSVSACVCVRSYIKRSVTCQIQTLSRRKSVAAPASKAPGFKQTTQIQTHTLLWKMHF